MKGILLLAVVGFCTRSAFCAGAGRAIPIASENFVVELFQSINPRIQYDATNFLVDLSGLYANCNFIRLHQLSLVDDRKTPDGATIGVIQDSTFGEETHTNAVDKYIRPVFESWVRDRGNEDFRQQIVEAEKFGCSVRPGCNGQVSIACLFSPASIGVRPRPTYRPTPRPTPRPRPTFKPKPTRPPPTFAPPITGKQKAQAFTTTQYYEAEKITGQEWDNSYYLENLSGYETDCSMVGQPKHEFANAISKASDRGIKVIGLFGYARNQGSTPKALEKILKNMKKEGESDKDLHFYFNPLESQVRPSKMVGCSLIPDCVDFRQMYVVVSCIFET